jgi:hypothetical protein
MENFIGESYLLSTFFDAVRRHAHKEASMAPRGVKKICFCPYLINMETLLVKAIFSDFLTPQGAVHTKKLQGVH